MPVVQVGVTTSGNTKEYQGLSTDIKPTDCGPGSTFYELNTGNRYIYDPSNIAPENNSNWWKIQLEELNLSIINSYLMGISNIVFPEYFGAKGDGVKADDNAFVNAIEFCIKNNKLLGIGNKAYLLSKPLDTRGVTIVGNNKFTSIIKGIIKIGSYHKISNITLIGAVIFNSSSCKHVDFINCILDGDGNKYSQFSIADGELQYISFQNCEFCNGIYALNLCNKGDAFHIHHITVKNCYFHDNLAMNFQCIARYYTKENVIYGYNDILIEDSVFIGIKNATNPSQSNVSFDGYFYNEVNTDNNEGLLLCRDVIIRNCKLINGFYVLENAGTGNMTIENCIIERNDNLNNFLISCSGNIRLINKDIKCNLTIRNCKIRSLGSGPNDIVRIGGNGLVFENNDINISIDNLGIGIQRFIGNLFNPITKSIMLLVNPQTNYQSIIFIDTNIFITSYSSNIITCYGGTADSKLYATNNKVLSNYVGSPTEIQFILHDVTGKYNGSLMLSNNLDSNGEIMQSRELLSKTLKTGVTTIKLNSGFDININPNKLNSWNGPNFAIFNFNILYESLSGFTKRLDFSMAIGNLKSISSLKTSDIEITGPNANKVNLSLLNNNYTIHVNFTGDFNPGLPTALKYETLSAISDSYSINKS